MITIPEKPPGNKVLVVNSDFHGRTFPDMFGNVIEPGQMCWLNKAHADALNQRNRNWKIVEVHLE